MRLRHLFGATVVIAAVLAVLPAHESARASGSPLPTGDANCDLAVSSLDAAAVLQYAAGLVEALPCEYDANVHHDWNINANDALLILQHEVGLLDSLPPLFSAAGMIEDPGFGFCLVFVSDGVSYLLEGDVPALEPGQRFDVTGYRFEAAAGIPECPLRSIKVVSIEEIE